MASGLRRGRRLGGLCGRRTPSLITSVKSHLPHRAGP